MKLSNLVRQELICLDLESTEKNDSIIEMVEVLVQKQVINDREIFLKEVSEREKFGSSGIGDGVAIPHARTEVVEEIIIAFGRSQKGIDFGSLDRKPVYLVFLIASPTKDNDLYLRTLARLSRFLREIKFRHGLLQAKTPDEVFSMLNSFEEDLPSLSSRF